MRKIVLASALALLLVALSASAALAAPPEKVEGFVSPVLGGQAGEHGKSPVIQIPDGYEFYTVPGPQVTVPIHATNMDGAGNPYGEYDNEDYAVPGDPGYSPIWNTASSIPPDGGDDGND
jgi:hypothetical protein